jgi:type I restriction enzyme S subunit
MNTGSAQPQITISTLEKYMLPIPPFDKILEFSRFVYPYKEMYRNNVKESKKLGMIRDNLLPKLMSGELDVSNIDI